MKEAAIVCVDDEHLVLNGLQSELAREFGAEYIVELAESGEEALELVDELLAEGRDVPVIISDEMMPNMKGHELLIEVHKRSPKTFKILLTGQSDVEAISEAVNKANLYRYISKPWNSTDLELTVREAIKSFYQDKQLEVQNRLLERHNRELENLVEERTQQLKMERDKSDELLLNILPDKVAQELKEKGTATPRHYKMVTVLFTDFQSFTKSAADITPEELVDILNENFTAFDEITARNGMEKVKTIGDAYMAAGGIPSPNTTNAHDAVAAAIAIRDWIAAWNAKRVEQGKDTWHARIGIHTGELIAGVIGKRKFAYDVWGDAVNVASRMETSGEPDKINISKATYELVKDQFQCTPRGLIEVKGRGDMEMWFVEGAK